MQIALIKENKLILFTLPKNRIGSYWLSDFENGRKINLMNIDATEEGWLLYSNREAFIIDNQEVMVPYVKLEEGKLLSIKNNYKQEKYYLYCSPLCDQTFREFNLVKDEGISVGNGDNNKINYQLPGLSSTIFTIEKQEKYYMLKLVDENSFVYVNQKRVRNVKKIEYGDIIFVFGLKLILMRKEGADYFLVNNPNGLVAPSALYATCTKEISNFNENYEELTLDYYGEDYFYRTPRFYEKTNKFVLKIDAPPFKKDENQTPAILTIGPMLTMSMMSVVMLMSTMNAINKGERTVSDSATSIAMCIVMLASSLLWPTLTKAYQKFSDKRWEKKRQKLYKKYLDKKEKEIEMEMNKQKSSLVSNNLSVSECLDIIRAHNVRLWQRRIGDEDFLDLPVGIGNIPMEIEVQYPEEHFSLTEDNLLDLVHELGETKRILRDVPITYSFYENKATGIVGSPALTKELADRLLLQIMTNYSYDEVKIVTFTSLENESLWDYVKTLPHSWSNDHTFRYFGSTNDEYREMIYQLDKIFHERRESKEKQKHVPHYVLVTDAIKSIDNYDLIKNILGSSENYGFSIIMLVDRVSACPNECKNFIHVNQEECAIFKSVLNEQAQSFKMDLSSMDELYNCSKELANIKVEIKSETESSLPDVYHFLEMYQVGKVEQLNSLDRWKKSNPMLSLQTPVGIGKGGEIISLDLHEKYHGPHGLIAGTTGSGKSEFIISYVLSLAVNYSPYEVQVILIDYKGGGLALAFQNDYYTLPHLAGIMTNLDGSELTRSLASIESEIKRRQREFNEARVMTNESTIDIYKYQKLWREGRLKGKDQIAHLFIISDEFAELKEQQPEFMDKLISVARVGRSLGVHLILATQKPGGVVDQQIWSNTRFRVCLKVQDTGDSQEVLKKPDAAYLKKTGRFYLQVGYDEVFTLGQAAWAGARYIPSQMFKKDVDTSVNLINNIGITTMSKDTQKPQVVHAEGEELSSVVKYLSDLARNEHIEIKKLWLEKIPEKIYVDSLKSKYNFKRQNYILNPIIGEYDDPDSQNQYVLTLPLFESGNAIVYGIADSGKEEFLETLVYSGMTTYSIAELNFYLLDFGGETLRNFVSAPHVGDIAYLGDTDKIINLFKMIEEELQNRKNLFASFGGSYINYLRSSGKTLPNIVVVLNNYEAFVENYEDLNEELTTITREATRYGIYFVMSASSESSVRMRLKQNFNLIYALQQNNDFDYSAILGNVRGKVPSKIKGRGLFKKDKIYEFQTASIKQENTSEYIREVCEKFSKASLYRAKKIPVLPEVVNFESIESALSHDFSIAVGVNKETLTVEKYNFSKNALHFIGSYDIENVDATLNAFINQICYEKYANLYFFNASEHVITNENLTRNYITKNIEENLLKILDYIDQVYAIYEQNHMELDSIQNQKKMYCFIYGLYSFMNKLSDEAKKRFGECMKKDAQMNLISFVIIDNPDVIKPFTYEEWFKVGADLTKGIWIGSGVADQTLFKISKITRDDREEIPNDFGYVINNAKLYKVKLLTDFKAKDTNI